FGLVGGLGLTSQRSLFRKASLWKALFILVLLLMPNLIWQLVHHFPVVEHMKVLKIRQLDNNTSLGFLKDQVMFFSGSLVLIIGGLVSFIYHKSFKVYRFVGICFVIVISVFACLKAKNYYSIGLYPVLIAFGSVFIERLLSRKWIVIVIPALIGINLATFILTARFVYPVDSPSAIKENPVMFEKIGMLRWEDGKNHAIPQDFADMIGWNEMADKALAAYKELPEAERRNTLIFCDNYGQAGALNYYNRKKMPPAFSFNTDYIFWLPRQKRILNVLLVGKMPSDKVVRMFNSVQLTGKVDNEFSREKGTGIYLLKDADVNFTAWFYAEAGRRIKSFDIF
ncbi:MAG: glycosyl transferase, partial [Bacteroidota bacterium]|nr:glycosyl transferase [Bacteroidota bacterium]